MNNPRHTVNSLGVLTPEQHGALALVALQMPLWRDYVKHLWYTSRDDTYKVTVDTEKGRITYALGPYLRQVRNNVGPHGLDELHLADVAQVFEISGSDTSDPYFRFNGWFIEGGGVYDDLDIRLLSALKIGDTLKPNTLGECLITRRA